MLLKINYVEILSSIPFLLFVYSISIPGFLRFIVCLRYLKFWKASSHFASLRIIVAKNQLCWNTFQYSFPSLCLQHQYTWLSAIHSLFKISQVLKGLFPESGILIFHCPPFISTSLLLLVTHICFNHFLQLFLIKCLFGNNLFSWNWKLFAKNTVDKTKR